MAAPLPAAAARTLLASPWCWVAPGLLSAGFAYAPVAEHGSCSLPCSALPSHQLHAAPPAL